jgi:hypothetical protein
MAVTFKMSDLVLLHYYLRIEVKQSASRISISQGAYTMKVSNQNTQPLVDATAYRSIVGSISYLVNTRSNLMFVVGCMSCFLKDPREDHLAVVKWILRYVVGTSNSGLWFGRKKRNQALLTRFSNDNFAGDVDTSEE